MAEGLLENGAEVVLMDLQAEKLQSGENAGLQHSLFKRKYNTFVMSEGMQGA